MAFDPLGYELTRLAVQSLGDDVDTIMGDLASSGMRCYAGWVPVYRVPGYSTPYVPFPPGRFTVAPTVLISNAPPHTFPMKWLAPGATCAVTVDGVTLFTTTPIPPPASVEGLTITNYSNLLAVQLPEVP